MLHFHHALFSGLLRCTGEHRRLKYLREFRRSQYRTREQIEHLQLTRLQAIVRHAYTHCPFYRKSFARLGVRPDDIRTLDDLRHLPVLEKSHIQEDGQSLVATNMPGSQMIANQTGGSTGTPISFYLSPDRLESRAAATLRHDSWAGLDIGDRRAYLWGAVRDAPRNRLRSRLRAAIAGRELWLDTSHVTEDKMREFDTKLKQFRPRTMIAYAQAATLFARFLKTTDITPYQPRSMITSAEMLTPEDRALLEDTFSCKVFNRYGCREVSVIASECEYHTGMHLMAEGIRLEVVSDGSPLPAGSRGEVLVTDLLNYAMPLIRYRIGDVACLRDDGCACGRGLPLIQDIGGRVTDFLVGDDGQLVSGVFLATYVVARRPSLGQVQIVQNKKSEILYRIKPASDFDQTADVEYLAGATARYLGNGIHTRIAVVREFEVAASGKFMFSESTVTPDWALPSGRAT